MLAPVRVESETILVDVARSELGPGDPLALYRAVRASTAECYLFESLAGPAADLNAAVVGWGRLAEVRIHADRVELAGVEPVRAALSRTLDEVLGPRHRVGDPEQIWSLLRALTGRFTVRTDLPADAFAFGFLTALGYSAAWDIESLPARPGPEAGPGYVLTLFQHTAWFDLRTGNARLVTAVGPLLPTPPPVPALDAVPDVTTHITTDITTDEVPAAPVPVSVRDSVTAGEFGRRVERCLDHIGVGDIYQIQIGHRIDVETSLTPFEAYLRLRRRSPAPYMYLLPWAGRTVVGASPELYVRVVDGRLVMRPIAGTAPPGRPGAGPGEVADLSALRDSVKQQAEHVMLVDLARNDIGRVIHPGTLSVDSLMEAEPFGYVNHLVSTVSGRLHEDVDIWGVIRATFPAGTMTGAPKIRAMELIHEIEDSARGLYAGAVGLLDVRGFAVFALCIRTAVHEGDRFGIQASAGVVADSEPGEEWAETLAKLSAAYWALTGEELSR